MQVSVFGFLENLIENTNYFLYFTTYGSANNNKINYHYYSNYYIIIIIPFSHHFNHNAKNYIHSFSKVDFFFLKIENFLHVPS